MLGLSSSSSTAASWLLPSSSSSSHHHGTKSHTTTTRPTELAFFKGKYIFEVACGGNHTILLEKNPDQDGGHVWAFGMAHNGRLGRADLSNTPELVIFPDATCRIARIACGTDHTLVISEHGQVWAWGLGNYGNLGLGTSEDASEPRLVTALDQKHTIQVACGSKHSLALTSEGFVYAWGYGGDGRLGLRSLDAALSPKLITSTLVCDPRTGEYKCGTPMCTIAAGEAHSACVDNLGNVYTWGAGAYGRCGHGEETDAPVPRKVENLGGIPCSKLALGMLHSVVLTTKGKLYAWGTGAATGLASPSDSSVVPTPREVLTPHVFSEVACGTYHTIALSAHGELFTWGLGTDGRLGLGTQEAAYSVEQIRGVKAWRTTFHRGTEIVPVTSKSSVYNIEGVAMDKDMLLNKIACGGAHSAVLLTNGSLFTWGDNQYGQVGIDTKTMGTCVDVIEPYMTRSLGTWEVSHVSCGLEHTLAIAGGRLWAWGRGDKGQLGMGKSKEALEPAMIQTLNDVVDASAGEDHSAAVLASGELYTWGNAECGKLGHGASMTTASQYLPRQVKVNDRIEAVHCGSGHTMVVNATGIVFSFGAGWFGRLGHGTTMNAYVPTPLDLPSETTIGKRDVFPGSFHTCLIIDQELWVTGRDRLVCAPDHVLSPIKFAPFEESQIKVATCAPGPQHTVIITTAGQLYVWGENKSGQLGVGRMQARLDTPEMNKMFGHKKVIMVATGARHTLVLQEDGILKAMGSKMSGRLSIPVKGYREKVAYGPVQVDERWKKLDDQFAGVRDTSSEEGLDEDDSGIDEGEDVLPLTAGEGPKKTSVAASSKPSRAASTASPFLEIQQQLQKEDEKNRADGLAEEAQKLSKEYKQIMDNIHLVGKSTLDIEKQVEGKIRKLESDLEASLCFNLQALGLHEQRPKVRRMRLPQEITNKMGLYEELIFILQQHPCYLANLSTRIAPHDVKASVFFRAVKKIFARLNNARIRQLYKCLIRQVMTFEVCGKTGAVKKVEHCFDPAKSLTVTLVKELSLNSIYTKPTSDEEGCLFDLLFSMTTDEKPSLAAHIMDYTCDQLFFAFEVEDVQDLHDLAPAVIPQHIVETHEKVDMKLREWGDRFAEFFKTCFRPWVIKFINILPTLADDVSCLFFKAFSLLEDQPYAEKFRGSARSAPKPTLMYPLVTLLLSGILAPAFENAKQVMTYQFRRKLTQRCHEEELLNRSASRMRCAANTRGSSSSTALTPIKDPEVLERLVYWNMARFAHFLRHVAANDFPTTQLQNLELGKELRLKLCTTYVSLFSRATVKEPHGGTAIASRGSVALSSHTQALAATMTPYSDKTEMQLTVGLYTSHYDPGQNFIQIPTWDLLMLSNMMWEALSSSHSGSGGSGGGGGQSGAHLPHVDLRCDHESSDVLEELLRKIQPTPRRGRLVGGKPAPVQPPGQWDEAMLIIAKETEVVHNLTVPHRFLFQWADVCFCRTCQSAIPRRLAHTEQKKRKILRYVKPYVAPMQELKFTYEGDCHPFSQLEETFYRMGEIRSRDFITLKFELEEKQKAFTQGRNTDFAKARHIEQVKKVLDKLRQHNVREEDLINNVEENLQARREYKEYLDQVGMGKQSITDSKKNYEDWVKVTISSLERLVQSSQSSTVHKFLKQKAQDLNAKLRFLSLEKQKKKARTMQNKKLGLPSDAPVMMLEPSRTLALSWLRAQKVVIRMGQNVPESTFRDMFFMFRKTSQGWDVEVMHHGPHVKRTIREWSIEMRELDAMKSAGKFSHRGFADNFVVVDSFELIQLLARIAGHA